MLYHFENCIKLLPKAIFLIFIMISVELAAIQITPAEQINVVQDKLVQMTQVNIGQPMLPMNNNTGSNLLGRITLDLRNIDVVDALKFLSVKAGINIITTKSVSGRVTLMVQNAPIQDVLDIMLRSNNLAFDRKGEIYNVMTHDEYKALYGRSFSDVRKVKVFYLKYAIPEQAFSLLDMLKSEVGRVLVDPESGNVLVMDSEEKIELIEKVLEEFEEKNTVKVLKLNYAKAKDIEEALKTQLDSKRVGLIKANERDNQVIVQTLPSRMEQIERLIKELDQKTKEIIIDVNIVQIKLSDDLSEGVQWEGLFDLGRKFGLTYLGSYPFSSVSAANDPWRSRNQVWQDVGNVGSYPFSGTTSNYSAGKKVIGTEEMHLGVVGKQDFDVVLKYLQTVGKTKILSNPKIAVVNNQEAKIHVGQKEAYVTTTTTTGQTTNTISEQVTFVDVGVIISVVPNINSDGYVTLKVKVEINSVIDTLITPTKNQIPIIDTSLAETTVMVKEGSTVFIGGLRKEQNVETTRLVPVLGKLPVLGHLFRVKSNEKECTELLLILTPKLISGDVLVSSTDKNAIGESKFKPIRDYLEIKKDETLKPLEPGYSPAVVPIGKTGLDIKGYKSVEP